MRTTITIDDELIDNLMQLTGEKNYAAAIRHALECYLKRARKERVLALRGKVQIDNNWQELRQLDTIL